MRKPLLLISLTYLYVNWVAADSQPFMTQEVQSITAPPTYIKKEPITSWINFGLRCPHSVSLFSGRKDIKFVLYNKDYPHGTDISQDLGSGKLFPNTPIRFLIHGFLNSGNTEMVQTLKNAFLARTEKFNVIAVDWSKGSGTASMNYYNCLIPSRVVPLVGKGLAEFIVDMIDTQNINILYVNVIGFSLGGQIAGRAGKQLIELQQKLPVIVALDPAQPYFEYNKESERLTSTDADYVEVIHTNCGDKGFLAPIGTTDFYPNFGVEKIGRMPGCVDSSCSHARAVDYYAESILNPFAFEAVKCESFASLRDGSCRIEENSKDVTTSFMGGYEITYGKTAGVFYVSTNRHPPYGKSNMQLPRD